MAAGVIDRPVGVSLALALGGLLVAASPASAHCRAHTTHPDLYSQGRIHYGDRNLIRAQPHVGCNVRGIGRPGHGLDVHCFVITEDIWIFARDTTINVRGWTKLRHMVVNPPTTIRNCNSAEELRLP